MESIICVAKVKLLWSHQIILKSVLINSKTKLFSGQANSKKIKLIVIHSFSKKVTRILIIYMIKLIILSLSKILLMKDNI